MSNPQDFLTWVERQQGALQRRDEKLATQEDDIKKQRAEIRSKLADFARVVAVSTEWKSEPSGADATTPVAFPELAPEANGTGTVKTMADLAEDYLRSQGGRVKMSDLLAEMIRIGRLSGKDGDYGSLFGTLKRNPKRFRKVGPGEFAVVTS